MVSAVSALLSVIYAWFVMSGCTLAIRREMLWGACGGVNVAVCICVRVRVAYGCKEDASYATCTCSAVNPAGASLSSKHTHKHTHKYLQVTLFLSSHHTCISLPLLHTGVMSACMQVLPFSTLLPCTCMLFVSRPFAHSSLQAYARQRHACANLARSQ